MKTELETADFARGCAQVVAPPPIFQTEHPDARTRPTPLPSPAR